MVQIRTSGSENHDNNAIELKVIVANEGEDIGNINLNNFEIHLLIFYSFMYKNKYYIYLCTFYLQMMKKKKMV